MKNLNKNNDSFEMSRPKCPQDKTAPVWARYKAQDDDGTWHWFEGKPNFIKAIGKWNTIRGEVAECNDKGEKTCNTQLTH